MRIAIITDGIFPYVMGGMQKHSFYIVKYLAQNKINVDLFHFNQSSYDIDKLEFFTIEEKQFIHSHVIDFPKTVQFPGHYLYESYLYSKHIFKLIKNDLCKYDFIYAKGFAAWKLIKEKKRGLKCPPIGVKFHGLNMFQPSYSLRNRFESLLLRTPALYNMTHADYVFSYGGKITDLIKQIGVSKNKIIEIPTGVDESWLNLSKSSSTRANNKRSFVFIGRYDAIKGIKELNSAIRELQNQAQFDFHFIGPFPIDKQLKYDNIYYHGQITDVKKLQNVLLNCDVVLCPSYSEGMPNVIIESMAMGLAVIATDVGAINVLVSDYNGWLLEKPTKQLIIKNMLEAINTDENKLQKMKNHSIVFVQTNLKWAVIVQKLINTIDMARRH